MNKILTLFFFQHIFLFSLTQNNVIDPAYRKMLQQYYTGFETIQADEAETLIGKKNVYFLDTREEQEFEVSHIPTAILLGYHEIDWSKIKNIPNNAIIIVYCSVGVRSQTIGEELKNKGYKNVKNLYGGLFLWANQDRKMVDKNNKVTTKVHGYDNSWSKWIKKGKVIL